MMVVCSWGRGAIEIIIVAYDYLILQDYCLYHTKGRDKPITIDSVSVAPRSGRGSRLNPFKNLRRPIDRAASLILVVLCAKHRRYFFLVGNLVQNTSQFLVHDVQRKSLKKMYDICTYMYDMYMLPVSYNRMYSVPSYEFCTYCTFCPFHLSFLPSFLPSPRLAYRRMFFLEGSGSESETSTIFGGGSFRLQLSN